jgi:ParB family chromosome partitioning protein
MPDLASSAMAGEIDALRARLQAFDGAMPTVHLDPALVRPSRWSHRHESAYGSRAFDQLLDSVDSAGGIEQPILVRKDGAGYEVIFGHRRHRACLELGLAVFAVVWVGPMSDLDLFLALERENQGRQDLSPYEQGRMYDHALVMSLFSSQRRLASAIGVSHTWIRKTLQIARLPKEVIGAFADPTAIQPAHAADITEAIVADEWAVMRRAADLGASKHTTKRSAAAVVDCLVGRSPQKEEIFVLRCGSRTVGTWRRDGRGRAVVMLDADVSDDAAMVRVAAAIEQALGGQGGRLET